MRIGHLLLDEDTENGHRAAWLVRRLSHLGIEQHVLTCDESMLRTLASTKRVRLGPLVRTPIMACCLMPDVDLAHMHDVKSGQAGLLLTLTRSIPYVISQWPRLPAATNAISRSIYTRSRGILCRSEADRMRMRSLCPHALIELIPESAAAGEGGETDDGLARQYLCVYERMIDPGNGCRGRHGE